jgi:hypothetical protein
MPRRRSLAMMLVGSALKGFAIEGNDGKIGTVSEILSRAVEKVRTMFVKNPEIGPRQSAGPKP